jgi:hypothetical protein
MFTAAANVVAMDPRLALVLFVLLLLAASAPIVLGWLALLPSEREPFAAPGEIRTKAPRDAFAIFLLVNISLSVLLRVPGFAGTPLSFYIATIIPPDWADHALMIAFIWFGFIPGMAVVYSAVRANPIRMPLIVGGALALILWLAGPWLLATIVGVKRPLIQ